MVGNRWAETARRIVEAGLLSGPHFRPNPPVSQPGGSLEIGFRCVRLFGRPPFGIALASPRPPSRPSRITQETPVLTSARHPRRRQPGAGEGGRSAEHRAGRRFCTGALIASDLVLTRGPLPVRQKDTFSADPRKRRGFSRGLAQRARLGLPQRARAFLHPEYGFTGPEGELRVVNVTSRSSELDRPIRIRPSSRSGPRSGRGMGATPGRASSPTPTTGWTGRPSRRPVRCSPASRAV